MAISLSRPPHRESERIRRSAARIAWLLAAVSSLAGCAVGPHAPFSGLPTETVYVIGAGWHTEIGLPTASLEPPLAGLAARFPGAAVLTFGFGDRAFVLARHEDIGIALGALLPSPGLILVTALDTVPEAAFGARHVAVLHLPPAGLDHIARFIWDSLARKRGRPPQPYAPGPYPGSIFYPSSVSYDGFYTCNTWAAEALGAGGLPIQAEGVLFASELMREARAPASP